MFNHIKCISNSFYPSQLKALGGGELPYKSDRDARCSLQQHPFLLAPRLWGRFLRKSEEKRMFSQAILVEKLKLNP